MSFVWDDVEFGKVADPDRINQLGNAVSDLYNPVRVVLRQTVAQNLPWLVVNPITFDVEDIDTHGGHDSTNPSRWYVPYTGWYQLSGGVGYSPNATGIRTCQWWVNGADINGGQIKIQAVTGGVATVMPARTLDYQLVAGQYVELGAFQNGVNPLATSVVGNEQSMMQIRLLSRT